MRYAVALRQCVLVGWGCSTLRQLTVRYRLLQHVTKRYGMLHYECYDTLEHVVTRYCALRYIGAHYGASRMVTARCGALRVITARCNMLQYAALRSDTPRYTTLRHTAACCGVLRSIAATYGALTVTTLRHCTHSNYATRQFLCI